MYVGVGGCCTLDMLILNTFNMQNADEHFPLEGFEMLLHHHSARNIWKNNRWGERDNRIKDGILGFVCHFIILLLELYQAVQITGVLHSAVHRCCRHCFLVIWSAILISNTLL